MINFLRLDLPAQANANMLKITRHSCRELLCLHDAQALTSAFRTCAAACPSAFFGPRHIVSSTPVITIDLFVTLCWSAVICCASADLFVCKQKQVLNGNKIVTLRPACRCKKNRSHVADRQYENASLLRKAVCIFGPCKHHLPTHWGHRLQNSQVHLVFQSDLVSAHQLWHTARCTSSDVVCDTQELYSRSPVD